MTVRHLLLALIIAPIAVAPAIVDSARTSAGPAPAPPVPAEALAALEEGRYWHASRILHEYLAGGSDTAPRASLVTARADAGWGGWSNVEALLAGRHWLDTLDGGSGWNLLGRARYARGNYDGAASAFERYVDVATDADDKERGIAEFRRGLALLRGESDSAALAAFDRAAVALPPAEAWIGVRAVEAAAASGDTAGVERRLAGLEPGLRARFGWRSRVEARRQAGDLEGAARAASVAERVRPGGDGAAAAFTLGDLRVELGDTAAARAALRRAIEASPGSSAAVDAARRLSELPGLTPDDRLAIGRTYLRHGNAARAADGIGAYLEAGLGSSAERDRLRLDLGRSLFNAGRHREAERVLLDLVEAAPEPLAADALFLAGRAQYGRGATDAGRRTFLRTADRFPGSGAAAEAVFLAADLDHDDGRIERARELYRRVVDVRPDAYEAGLARMRLAGLALLDGDHEAALSIFEAYRREYPTGRRYDQATYWAAKTYLELGDTALARERLREVRRIDPFSYYAVRAADHLDEQFFDVPLPPAPETAAATEAAIASAFDRIGLLDELGFRRGAAEAIDDLVRRYDGDDGALYALAEALNARGFTTTGIQLGWDLHDRRGGWDARLLRIIYPFPYEPAIRAEADERGLDPYLVAGLIRQESMFRAGAQSPAGAIGLMQIMPYTGRALARGARIDDFHAALLERPDINLHLGTGYLAELLDRFDARAPAVLAAYNAGPHRVRGWSALPEYGHAELFTERIPYRETRHYVKVVQQNARLYAALYGDGAARPADDR